MEEGPSCSAKLRDGVGQGLRGVVATFFDSKTRAIISFWSSSSFICVLLGFGVRRKSPQNMTTIPNENPIHWFQSKALNSWKNMPPERIAKKMKLHCNSGMMKIESKSLSPLLSRPSQTTTVRIQMVAVAYVNQLANMSSSPLFWSNSESTLAWMTDCVPNRELDTA